MLGVIKALEDNNIKIDAIGGTSAGSFVATLYAMGYSPTYIYSLFKKYGKKLVAIDNKIVISEIRNLVFNKKVKTRGMKNGEEIEELYNKLAIKKGVKKLEDIQMPLVIPAVDISESKEYIFTSVNVGTDICAYPNYISDISVGKAVRSSSSFPAIITPCEFKGHIFSDGGTLNNIPTINVKNLEVDKVIAVRFDSETIDSKSNAMDIMMKTLDIMSNKISEEHLEASDYILTVPSNGTGLLDISKVNFCYKAGYNTVIENLEEIKNVLAN